MLNVAVPEIGLQRVPCVRQSVSAGLPEHVGMDLEPEPSRNASARSTIRSRQG